MRRKNDRVSIKTILFIIIGIVAMMLALFLSKKIINENSIKLFLNDAGKVELNFESSDECYVLETDSKFSQARKYDWIEAKNNAVFDLCDSLKYYYVKCGDKVYFAGSNDGLGSVELSLNNDEKYLIKGNTYSLDYDVKKVGYISSEPLITSSDEKVIVEEDGKIKAVGNGKATVSLSLLDKTVSTDFVVTDLIVEMPDEFDEHKELLPCERYTKEDNDLFDELLEYRISEAGYQTRGGVVAATRFLLLEFPYRLTYFYEWGRQTYDKVDGEGRYYIKGMYLDESRYERLVGSNTGPATWGCKLYSSNLKQYDINGLDCSGFVTWVLLNAGFDCGDIGSGYSQYFDLTETGKLVKNNKKTIADVKVGDLTHSNYMGGHIGILTGIKDGYYYVAQATPKNDWGVTLTKYTADEFIKEWDATVLMDSYYKEEGIYTDYWK